VPAVTGPAAGGQPQEGDGSGHAGCPAVGYHQLPATALALREGEQCCGAPVVRGRWCVACAGTCCAEQPRALGATTARDVEKSQKPQNH